MYKYCPWKTIRENNTRGYLYHTWHFATLYTNTYLHIVSNHYSRSTVTGVPLWLNFFLALVSYYACSSSTCLEAPTILPASSGGNRKVCLRTSSPKAIRICQDVAWCHIPKPISPIIPSVALAGDVYDGPPTTSILDSYFLLDPPSKPKD